MSEKKGILDQFPDVDEEFRQQQEELTFEEYVNRVWDNPKLARNSFQRVYDMINQEGSEPSGKVGAENVPRYNFFDDALNRGENALFGIEEEIDKIMTFLRAGAKAQDAKKRLLVLNGPVGTAKSTLMNLIKAGLEHYSRTPEGALYTFEWQGLERNEIEISSGFIEDHQECPIREDPLKLFPAHLIQGGNVRQDFLDQLNEGKEPIDKIHLPGGLCPLCQFHYDNLLKKHDGNWKKVLEHVRVKRLLLSQSSKRGIGTFAPKDEKNQDSTELTGDTDLTKLGIYGFETDPRAFGFNGEFMVGNRGLVEFIEVLKLQVEFLYDLLHATAENQVKGKGMPFMWIDTLLVAHTNIPEYNALIENERMEAFRDRLHIIKFPYVTELSEEKKIYVKLEKSGKFERHFAPHSAEVAGLIGVLSRIEEPSDQGSLMAKAKAYDGKTLGAEYGPEKVKELREKAKGEAMSGISPRQIQNFFIEIDNATRFDGSCITPYTVFKVAEEWITGNDEFSDEQAQYLQSLVDLVKEEFDEIAKDDIIKALSSDVRELQNLCDIYMNNIRASLQDGGSVLNERTGERMPPDEELMVSIEQRMGISTPDAAQKMRTALAIFMTENLESGSKFKYDSDDRLYKALRAELFERMKGTINWAQFDPDNDMTEKMKERYELLLTELEKMGYCDSCAGDLIRHAAGLFNKS